MLPEADLLALWSDKEIEELQEPELVQEVQIYRESLDEDWNEVRAVLDKYPEAFPKGKVSKELFTFAYANVVTRCFGWGLPCTMLIPVADALNHSSVDSSNEMFDLKLHTEEAKSYATKSKMKIDYSDITKLKAESAVVVKSLLIDEDVLTVCKDMRELDMNKEECDIWNMYFCL